MTRGALRAVGAGLLAASIAVSAPAAGQDWRSAGVAAFDAVWQIVNDTFYDPAFGGLDWPGVRADLRPRAEAATSVEAQRNVIRDMLGRLGQSHFALLTAAPGVDDPNGPASVPFDVRVTDAGLIVTRVHTGEGTQVVPGDRIDSIDDLAVSDLVGAVDPRDPRAAHLAWRRVMRVLSGAEGTWVRLAIERPGEAAQGVQVRRVTAAGDIVAVGNLPAMRALLETEEHRTESGRRVGVIRFNIWMAAIAEPFAEAVDRFRDADGIVIDLRGNPGGLADMIRGVAGHLVDEPVVLGRMRMRDLDLEFRANPRRSTSDGRRVVPFTGPVAVLVDGMTASASECFAGGLQSLGRVRVFGTRTMGQALPASTQQLVNGDVLLYAVGDFVTSTGRRIEGAGVVPDVEVPIEPESLAAGQTPLHAALEWLDTAPRPDDSETPR